MKKILFLLFVLLTSCTPYTSTKYRPKVTMLVEKSNGKVTKRKVTKAKCVRKRNRVNKANSRRQRSIKGYGIN